MYTWNVILTITMSINTLVYDSAKTSAATLQTVKLPILLTIYALNYVCSEHMSLFNMLAVISYISEHVIFQILDVTRSKINQQDIQHDTTGDTSIYRR